MKSHHPSGFFSVSFISFYAHYDGPVATAVEKERKKNKCAFAVILSQNVY